MAKALHQIHLPGRAPIMAGETFSASSDVVSLLVTEGAATRGNDDLSQLDHDGDGQPGGSNPDEPPALSGKNKAELLAIADAEGVTVEDGATNDAIRDAIELARAGGDEPAPLA